MGKGFEPVWDDPALRVLVAPLAGLYALGWTAYRLVYDLGLKRAYVPRIPSVCIGNLRVGGTGKTPMAATVVRMLEEAGRSAVLSVSGYRSPAAEGATEAPEGPLDPARWGDEAALLRSWFPQVPLVVGRDRVSAAQTAETRHPDRVLVLDDGYQHLRLACRVSILLDPPSWNTWCLPAGPYREPRRSGRKRATLALPDEQYELAREWSLSGPGGGPADVPPEVQVLTAVARPDALIRAIEGAGGRVVYHIAERDHDPLDGTEVWEGFQPNIPIVVTGKDWVKLVRNPAVAPASILVADYTWSVEPEDRFRAWLLDSLDASDR